MKLTIVSLLVPILAYLEATSAQADAGCAASVIFNQCLRNQDIYIKTCSGQDYACLCKWHTTKLSCWDNCMNDVSRGSQEGLKTTFCSIATPINATTSSVGSITATASQVPASSNGSKSNNVAGLSPSAAPAAAAAPAVGGIGGIGPAKVASAATAAALPSLGSTKNSTNNGSNTSHSSAMRLETGPLFMVAIGCYWFL
ncbi:hypothetical protein CLU79DRAFT_423545 [Phycomyces nitens]|nr:hypothetical protein CLU79DRAFT_423545 [Phycomyces nitens]